MPCETWTTRNKNTNTKINIGKSVRRRAASMETSKYEKRRGRVKKQVENLKNGGGLRSTMTTIIIFHHFPS